MEALLDRNANPFAKDADGDTPLHRAVYSGWVGICEAIVRRSPDTIASVDAAGRTPRQVADGDTRHAANDRESQAPRPDKEWEAIINDADEALEHEEVDVESPGGGGGQPRTARE